MAHAENPETTGAHPFLGLLDHGEGIGSDRDAVGDAGTEAGLGRVIGGGETDFPGKLANVGFGESGEFEGGDHGEFTGGLQTGTNLPCVIGIFAIGKRRNPPRAASSSIRRNSSALQK